MTTNMESIQNMTHELMNIIFEKQDSLGHEDFHKCSSLLKTIYDTVPLIPRGTTTRITVYEQNNINVIRRELHLQSLLAEERLKYSSLILKLTDITNSSIDRNDNTIQINRLMNILRSENREQTVSDSESIASESTRSDSDDDSESEYESDDSSDYSDSENGYSSDASTVVL